METLKELTHDDWMKKPTPRLMWVWQNGDENKKQKRRVVHIMENTHQPVIVQDEEPDGTEIRGWYDHCAEIGYRLMTYQELSWWLRDCPEEHRECKKDGMVSSSVLYFARQQKEEVPIDEFSIRSNGGEWREPFIEEE